MPSKWILHVKEFSTKHKMSYRDALKDPKCKSSYKTISSVAKNVDGKGLRAVARKMHGKGQGSSKVAPTPQTPQVDVVSTVQEQPSEANYTYLDDYPDESLFDNEGDGVVLSNDLDELIDMYQQLEREYYGVRKDIMYVSNATNKRRLKTELKNIQEDMQKIKSKIEKIMRRNEHFARG